VQLIKRYVWPKSIDNCGFSAAANLCLQPAKQQIKDAVVAIDDRERWQGDDDHIKAIMSLGITDGT